MDLVFNLFLQKSLHCGCAEMVLALSLMSMFTIVYTADQCKRIYSVHDRILSNHVIRTITQKSFHDCVYDCEEDLNCYSTNYFIPNSTCQLNNATAERHLTDFVAWSDAMYMGSLVRDEPVKVDSPCNKRDPPCDGYCTVAPGSFVTTCVCLHSDLSTCQSDACKPDALGMESGLIPDSQLLASSTHAYSSLTKARLNSNEAWLPNTDDQYQWFQISFGSKSKIVTGIGTQGHKTKWYWTESYKIRYKQGAKDWKYYNDTNGQTKIFSGNTELGNTIVNNTFNPVIIADTVKILPVTFHGRMALRLELYGCDIAT